MTVEFFKKYLFSKHSGSVIRTISRVVIVGVGVGMTALVVTTSVMNGFNRTIKTRLLTTEPHLVLSQTPETELEVALIESLGSDHRLPTERVTQITQQDVIIRTFDGLFGGAVLQGYHEADLKDFLERIQQAQEGSFQPDSRFFELKEDEVILGVDLARSLGIFEGDLMLIIPPETLLLPPGEVGAFQRAKVKAVLNTRLPEIDGQLVIYNQASGLQTIARAGIARQDIYQIRLEQPEKAALFAKLLKTHLGVDAETWQERKRTLFLALQLEKWAMTFLLGLSVFLTSFSIAILLMLLMYQKRRDRGILRSMGMPANQLQKIFVSIGFYLALLGMGSGIVLGLILSFLLDRYPIEVLPDIYYDSTIPAEIDLVKTLWIIGFAFVLSLLASLIPARGGRNETIVESLK